MSGIHFTEVLLLAVIALIVLGPERLPVIARTVGKISAKARQTWQGVQSELQAELDLDHNRKILEQEQENTDRAAHESHAPNSPGAKREEDNDEPQR